MKQINQYIIERENTQPLWCAITISMFQRSTNLTKDSIKEMISSLCDVDGRLKKLSDCLAEQYPKEYLAYQPNDDEFLKKESLDKVTDQMAEFILKTLVK